MAATSDLGSCISPSNGIGGLSPANPFYALRYQYGMLLGVDDFETEQAYHRGKTRLHNAWLHREGVVWGLDVQLDTARNEIKVTAGLALDPAGHELHLEATACLDVTKWYEAHKKDPDFKSTTSGAGVIQFDAQVAIAFQACLARQVPALMEPCNNSGNTDTAYSRVNETVKLTLLPGIATPAPKPYWRLRLLFWIEPPPAGSGTLTQPAQDVVDARNHILSLPSGEQPAAYLAAFRRFAALDEIDLRPGTGPNGSSVLLFPSPDDAPVLLANIHGIVLDPTGGTLKLTAGAIDVTVRPTHVATSTIEELLCGPTFRETAPAPASQGPKIVPASVTAATGSTTITFTTDIDLQTTSVAPQAFSVTFLDAAGANPWKDLVPATNWNAGTKTVTLTLGTAPGTGLLRLIAKGTGPTPLVGTNSIALGGNSASADGHDFVWMKGV